MNKFFKIFTLFTALIAVPPLAGIGIMWLWNSIMPAVCGFAAITFWQAAGLFLLGQLLSSGFFIALFICSGSIHAIMHHHREWRGHWRNMTDKQRREFILRRKESFNFRNHPQDGEDAAEQ